MLLSLVLHTYSMRYFLPAAVMMGTAPTYVLAWGAWRLLSALLPARFYREVDDRLYTIYQSMVLFFFENYTGVQVIIYGDLPKNKENVIYLSNHQCTVDWIIADMLAIRQNALGHVRYVLKDGLKWLPLYGWYFSQHGGVYVKRSAKFNEKEMREKLRTQMKAETSMYLVIFPEGTRYNPEIPKVIADSQLFAEKEGLAILKHVLTPRVKATHVAIDTMKDYLDAVYDVTVAYEGTVDHKGQRKLAPSMTGFHCREKLSAGSARFLPALLAWAAHGVVAAPGWVLPQCWGAGFWGRLCLLSAANLAFPPQHPGLCGKQCLNPRHHTGRARVLGGRG
uniref:1-acylglycerol-3-phosphate O-acyltransferase 5 n=1 Tax=Cairina moschata TaxID=8855 RepID=A0A8C3CYH3_CAIMO